MPLLTSLLVILTAAAGGWLLATLITLLLFKPTTHKKIVGFSIIGVIPAMKPLVAGWLATAIEDEILSGELIEKKIDDPALMENLRPEIEKHIDVFLREKLKLAFPLLAGLMGEKTLESLKSAFLAEVELIFPSVLKNFSGRLLQQWQPAEIIQNKLSKTSAGEIEQFVRGTCARQIFLFKLLCAFAGALIGVVQSLLIIYLP